VTTAQARVNLRDAAQVTAAAMVAVAAWAKGNAQAVVAVVDTAVAMAAVKVVVAVANKRLAHKARAAPKDKAKDAVHAPPWVMRNHAVMPSHAAMRAVLLAVVIASPARPARHPVVNLTRCAPVSI
jgi:hypothetical protein